MEYFAKMNKTLDWTVVDNWFLEREEKGGCFGDCGGVRSFFKFNCFVETVRDYKRGELFSDKFKCFCHVFA